MLKNTKRSSENGPGRFKTLGGFIYRPCWFYGTVSDGSFMVLAPKNCPLWFLNVFEVLPCFTAQDRAKAYFASEMHMASAVSQEAQARIMTSFNYCNQIALKF